MPGASPCSHHPRSGQPCPARPPTEPDTDGLRWVQLILTAPRSSCTGPGDKEARGEPRGAGLVPKDSPHPSSRLSPSTGAKPFLIANTQVMPKGLCPAAAGTHSPDTPSCPQPYFFLSLAIVGVPLCPQVLPHSSICTSSPPDPGAGSQLCHPQQSWAPPGYPSGTSRHLGRELGVPGSRGNFVLLPQCQVDSDTPLLCPMERVPPAP